MGKMLGLRSYLLLSSVFLASASVPVLADSDTAPVVEQGQVGLAEIVVTAQRRAQNMQDVPIAVSAVTREQLEAKGVQNTLDLAQVVPGLSFTQNAGGTQVRIRGVGTSSFGPGIENPVAMYIDDIYIASTSGDFFDLANIERVEVLKGPQGTLFGRNATGGLVQVITPDPSHETSGLFRASYGNYQTSAFDGYVTGGLTDSLAADLAAHYSHQGEGWGRNLNTGNYVNQLNDDLLLRSKIMFEPSSSVKLILAGDYSSQFGSLPLTLQQRPGLDSVGFYELFFTNRLQPNPALYLPLINHGGFYDNNATTDPRALIRAYGTSLTASFDLGAVNLKSISGYRRTIFDDEFDLTRVPESVLNFDGTATWRQFSQEFKLAGASGPLNYTAGVYYFSSRDSFDPFALNFGKDLAFLLVAPGVTTADLTYHNHVDTKSTAGYAQASYEILPNTDLTLGGRYTHEEKSIEGTQAFTAYFGPVAVPLVPEGTPFLSPGVPDSLSYNNFSYRISLDHKLTSSILAYLSFNTGFKSGGYNLTINSNPPFEPETLKAWEVGLKMELLDKRLRLNLSAYQSDYTNIQVNNFVQTSEFISNGPKAKIKGIDAELSYEPLAGLTLSSSFSYIHDRFTEYPLADYYRVVPGCDTSYANVNIACKGNAAGNELPGTPTFTGSIGATYETRIGGGLIGLNGNLFHSSGFYGTTDNDPLLSQGTYNVLNASIYWNPTDKGLRFTLWGRNLGNEKYVTNIYSAAQQVTYQAAAPLTWGVSAEQKF